MNLLQFCPEGIYCPRADLWIDPWRPVSKAVITHAHADHARIGMGSYLCHSKSVGILKQRLGGEIKVRGIEYNTEIKINGVAISLHPAGHIPGSAQVRIEYKGEIWVVSGDYKTVNDGLSTPFEPVKCHYFITESTFGLPIYKWPPQQTVFKDINNWWNNNKKEGKSTVILGYSLGKAQRILQHLDESIGEIYVHGAIWNANQVLIQSGFDLKPTKRITPEMDFKIFPGNIIIAPPSALASPWIKKFHPYEVATASGWMILRGAKRRRNVDRGFILSDHADWNELNTVIKATGAEKVFVTHGYTTVFSNWLNSLGISSSPVSTEFEGELSEIGESVADAEESNNGLK